MLHGIVFDAICNKQFQMLKQLHALIAQSVEQLPFKETVAGSNPAGGTKENTLWVFSFVPPKSNSHR
jgi:hypothetical protein